jgi:acetylornithine deacetylase/succinyl-diaminopimelate desuccinylase-like protein
MKSRSRAHRNPPPSSFFPAERTRRVGVRRNWVTFIGQADRAGTTSMERRRDGFLAAAEFALKARDLVVKRGSGRSVTNFGVVHVHPAVCNIVPARGELLHEMRKPDPSKLSSTPPLATSAWPPSTCTPPPATTPRTSPP